MAEPARGGASLLDPEVMQAIGPLDVVATRIVEGLLAGQHRSPLKGSSVEFAEHRAYSPGDETRLIDWHAYARSDRYYIRQFEEQTNLAATLVVDASGSMAFGMSTISKLRWAQVAMACLARLLLHQGDAVGLMAVGPGPPRHLAPRAVPAQFQAVHNELARLQPAGQGALAPALVELAPRLRRRGLVLIGADCFEELEPLVKAMGHLRGRGQDVVLLHVMAPEELAFDFKRVSQFQSLEADGERIDLDPAVVRQRYLDRVNRFLKELRYGCAEIGCDYVLARTDVPIGPTLAHLLGRRATGKG